MTHTYFFPEAGTISGIPGTFAGVQVEVDEESNQITRVSPLTRHPHFQASQEPDEQASEPEKPSEQEIEPGKQALPPKQPAEIVQSEPPEQPEQSAETEAAPPELPPEQPAQPEAPTNVEPPADEAGDHTESEN